MIAACSSGQVVTAVPEMDRIVSPTRSPPATAGVGVDGAQVPEVPNEPSRFVAVGTQGTTAPTRLVGPCSPMTQSTTVKSRKARTRFIVGPPSMTTMRLRTGSL